MALHINVIVLKKKSKTKKKNVRKKGYLIFIIENGEIPKILKFQKISNLSLDLKVKFLETQLFKILYKVKLT